MIKLVQFILRRSLPLFAVLILCNYTSLSQSSFATKIDSLIKTASLRPFNGVIVIAQNGEVKYAKSYGFADIDKKIALTLHAQFVIGSISKQINATLVLQEMEQGHLKLTDPISKYLPEIKEDWKDSVTIYHLLNHTSGIVKIDTLLAFKQGSKFSYSNLGYQLLGKIIEKTSGKTFATLTKELLERCNMSNTTCPDLYKEESKLKYLAKGYDEQANGNLKRVKDIFRYLQSSSVGIPAGGIISTAKDLIKWNQYLHQGKLLTDSSYKMMITSFAIRQHPVWGEVGYGYGLQINQQDSIYEIGHSGLLNGFASVNFYYPATQTSVIVLENISYNTKNIKRAFFFECALRRIVMQSKLLSRVSANN